MGAPSAVAAGPEARRRWSGGALSLLVHVAAAALFLAFGRTVVPVEPPPPLVADFLPAPEPPAPESELETELPVDLAAAAREPPALQPGSAEGGASAQPPADMRLTSPLQSIHQASPGAVQSELPGSGTGRGTTGESGADIGPAEGSGGGPGERTGGLARAEWIERLTSDQMLPYWPSRAAALRIDGRAWLACQITRSHRAKNCRILAETPRDYGFGYAAVRMSRMFRIRPPVVDGQPQYDAWVRVPVEFDVR